LRIYPDDNPACSEKVSLRISLRYMIPVLLVVSPSATELRNKSGIQLIMILFSNLSGLFFS
jgi:hypothetical protein